MCDSDGNFVEAHDSVIDLFGISSKKLLQRNLSDFFSEYSEFSDRWHQLRDGNESSITLYLRHADGYILPVNIERQSGENTSAGQINLRFTDLSRRTEINQQFVAMRESYLLLSETTTDAILQINSDLEIIFVNSAVGKTFGYEESEMLKKNVSVLFSQTHFERYSSLFKKYFIIDEEHRQDSGLSNVFEALARKKSNELIPVEISMGNSKGVSNSRILTCIIRDITLRKKADRRLRYLAYHDKLTSLGNRDRFAETLDRVLADISEKSDHHAALLYLDLDGFKKINDSLGHEIGDVILKACAKRLGNCLRGGDQVYRFDFEEIFRLGGDEFTIILPYINKPEDAAIVARRVIDKLTQPFSIEGWEAIRNIRLGVSIGIAVIPRDGKDRTTILRNADAAMYRAKERGNSFVFFTKDLNSMALDRLMMEQDLRRAFDKNEFELYYQPIVDPNGKIVSVEGLVRWNHPEKGILPPDKFLPIIEDIDLIQPLGIWVMSKACKQLSELHEKGFVDMTMSVNLSPVQLERENVGEMVRRILSRHEIEPAAMKIELTETSVMNNPEQARRKIQHIKTLNNDIKIAIDDFGTGYSSLAYLTRYSVDYLKIDKSFVMQMENEENMKVVKTIIDLGVSLGLEIVAEGVETKDQLAVLTGYGCHMFQGFYFSPPIPFPKLVDMLTGSV